MGKSTIEFNVKRRLVIEKLEELRSVVDRMDERTRKGADANWAQVGELGRIAAGLEDILVTARTGK